MLLLAICSHRKSPLGASSLTNYSMYEFVCLFVRIYFLTLTFSMYLLTTDELENNRKPKFYLNTFLRVQ